MFVYDRWRPVVFSEIFTGESYSFCDKCGKKQDPKGVSKEGCVYCTPKKPEDPIMEKYGVDTGTDPGEKIANSNNKCPRCGAELDKDSPVPKCPVHGTEPWERKEQ